ncbi:MAG: helix-turn-helix domain-containing protein [Actinobacteria bacterium]|nr:helix-turn-helix domain-containing protein [Actinomycetota bacterium]
MDALDLLRGPGPGSGPLAPRPAAASEPEVCRWPRDAHRRAGLLAQGRPCVWLLEPGELVPELGPLEDWLRLPADPGALEDLVQRLGARARRLGGLLPGEVHVDDDGLCTWGARRVVVPHVEAVILNRLGATPDRVVRRGELEDLVWPGAVRSRRAIDSRVHTLRSRLAPLGLRIHTIRGQGYLLAVEPPSPTRGATSPPSPRSSPWSN